MKFIFCNKVVRSMSLLLIALLLLLSINTNVYANTLTKIDAVLVIDASNSMNYSDPDKISVEAMKMFIDMLSINGDKVGIVSYTDQIEREKALLTINGNEDKKQLKDFVSQLKRGKYTDISVGFSEAVKILNEASDPTHKPIIVILSDGNNEIDESNGKSYGDIENEMSAAIKDCNDNGYPVYTIGLNYNGKLNTEYLKNISDSTKGRSFETATANDLPNILSQIFADHMELKIMENGEITANGEYQDVTINVPNRNVVEANVTLLSSQKVDTILIDPNGNEVKESDKLIKTNSLTFSMIKILTPEIGDWTLKVKGVSNDKIKINLLYNYALEFIATPLASNSYSVSDNVTFSAYLSQAGQKITDTALYNDSSAKLIIKDLDDPSIPDEVINCVNMGDYFEATYTIKDAHNYSAVLQCENESFIRETTEIQISASAVAATNPSTPAPSKPAPVTVTSQDSEEETAPAMSIMLIIIVCVIIVSAIVAILIILKVLKKSNKKLFGRLIIQILDKNTGSESRPQYKYLDAYGKSASLYDVIGSDEQFRELKGVQISPDKSSSLPELILKNNSPECRVLRNGLEVDASKGVNIKLRTKMVIAVDKINKHIVFEYIE